MSRWDQTGASEGGIPDWFWAAVEAPRSAHTVEVDECEVAYQLWESAAGVNAPGVLLIHGMNAHSHWWDFIAPALTDRYRVAAMDLTGMGDSDFRYTYDSSVYADEIVAVMADAGLGNAPIVVAHSFGGAMAAKAAVQHPERFGALVLVDSGMRDPNEPEPERPPMGGRAKLYPDKATAFARFRLQPPQDCANTYILEYIARQSLMPMDGGYTWKFDDDLMDSLVNAERRIEDYSGLRMPVGMIYGEDSALFTASTLAHMQSILPDGSLSVGIPDAQHHVFLDQPLAFIEALKDMLNQLEANL